MNPGAPQNRPPQRLPDPESLPLRFRAFDRRPVRGSAMAAFTDEAGSVTLTHVELRDESAGGLGLLCPLELRIGTRFALYAQNLPIVQDAGVVARCTPDGHAYRVGLRCDRKQAA